MVGTRPDGAVDRNGHMIHHHGLEVMVTSGERCLLRLMMVNIVTIKVLRVKNVNHWPINGCQLINRKVIVDLLRVTKNGYMIYML